MKRLYVLFFISLFFSTVKAQIPNADFENWSSFHVDRLLQWKNYGNIRKTNGPGSGTAASRMAFDSASADGSGRSGILFGVLDFAKADIRGGIPWTDRADSVYITTNYSFALNDSAWLVVSMKKAGIPMSFDIFRLGGTSSGFITRGFKLKYNLPGNPDTLLMALTASDPFTPKKASWIEVDNIWFVMGGSPATSLPNGDHEQWQGYDYDEPVGWLSANTLSAKLSGNTFPLSKTTDTTNGSYAVKVETMTDTVLGTLPGSVYTANRYVTKESPAFAVSNRILTLSGFYKFTSINDDSATIQVKVYNQGAEVGRGSFRSPGAASYTAFTFNVTYNLSFTGLPDSASILLASCDPEHPKAAGSTLWVDQLSMTTNVGIAKTTADISTLCFPNPATEQAEIKYHLKQAGPVTVSLYDISGRFVKTLLDEEQTAGKQQLLISLDGLARGLYYYRIETAYGSVSNKLVKE